MLINSFLNQTYADEIKHAQRENTSKAEKAGSVPDFAQMMEDRQLKCPYGYLAENGIIEYNGVVFICDPKTNSICLGDMSETKKVLNISLPSGGNLKVNVDNLGDLAGAVGMFSPEDLNAIMRAIHQYNHCAKKLDELEEEDDELMNAAQNSGHILTPDNIQKEDDWREMDEKQWNKLMEHVDKVIEDYKEELEYVEEMQKEAATKAIANAPADKRAAAASKAMLKAAANGMTGEVTNEDEDSLEKSSWTYEMETDDQVILATAKMANEFAPDMLTKAQEMALTGETSVGISATETVKECASLEEEENKKVWTITAFTEQGIISNRYVDGVITEHWEMSYKGPEDYRKVTEFLEKFDKDADLKFAGSQKFWEDFLAGRLDEEELDSIKAVTG